MSSYYRAMASPYLRVVRTEIAFPTTDAMEKECAELCRSLDPLRRGAMLYDSRLAVGRQDPEFEKALATWYPRVLAGFECVVILVSTAVGVMHTRRFAEAFGKTDVVIAVTDEVEAVRLVQDRALRERRRSR